MTEKKLENVTYLLKDVQINTVKWLNIISNMIGEASNVSRYSIELIENKNSPTSKEELLAMLKNHLLEIQNGYEETTSNMDSNTIGIIDELSSGTYKEILDANMQTSFKLLQSSVVETLYAIAWKNLIHSQISTLIQSFNDGDDSSLYEVTKSFIGNLDYIYSVVESTVKPLIENNLLALETLIDLKQLRQKYKIE